MSRFFKAAHALIFFLARGTACACMLYCASVNAADSAGLVTIKLNALWIVQRDFGASTITSDPVETTNADRARVIGYVASSAQDTSGAPLPDMQPLYRLVNGTSWRTGVVKAVVEGKDAYASDVTLGYLWPESSAVPGMVRIGKFHPEFKTVSISAQQPANSDGGAGYAFPRDSASERLIAVSAAGVTVKSNANAGGAVWEWWWHGKEFINDFDYGRQLSMALYCETGQALEETGDKYGAHNIPLYARHPTPTVYVKNVSANQQSTRGVPIEWNPDDHGGGKDHAVLYANAQIGKNLTLNWRGPDKMDRHWPVAMYESVYEGPEFAVANVESPTAYLNPEFSTYYKYDAKSDVLTPVPCNRSKVNISGGGADGLILASGPGPDAMAMGVYKNDPNAGIVLYDDSGPFTDHYGPSFSKWGIVYRSAVVTKWSFRSWIVTDSVQNIRNDFHQLYLWGVTSRDLPGNAAR